MPVQDTFCAGCDLPIADEVSSDRKPCPKCGSLGRQHALSASLTVAATVHAELEVKKYPDALLDTAKRLIESGEFGIATVVVHMACEVAADRALAEAYTRAGLDHMAEPVGELLNGFNLANDRIRKLYNAVSDDALETRHFWQAFKESASRRNAIMHRAGRATRVEAEGSLNAGRALIEHLGTFAGTKSPT